VDLLELLRRPEGKTVEYKRDLSSPEGALKTLVAFANTAGGVLAIGIENATRRVLGVPDILTAEERLANLVSDSIRPRLVPDIEILPWRKKQVLAARVYPSGARPHYLARLGPDEGVFVRVGSTNRRADAAQMQEMRRFADLGSFDEQPIPELSAEALDFRVASELFAPLRKLTPSAFRTLRVTTRYQEHEVPTVGGYILFAKDRFDRFPDAWIQAGRFAGKDRSRIVDSAEIRSHLPRALEEAIAFVQKHTSREAVIGPVRRTDRWNVPPAALREVVVNAVVHADYAERGAPIRVAVYDDRIEIENPGILPTRPDARGYPQGRLQAQEPRHWPRVPRAGPDRTVGQRHPENDGGLHPCRAARTRPGRDRQPLPCHPLHDRVRAGSTRQKRPGYSPSPRRRTRPLDRPHRQGRFPLRARDQNQAEGAGRAGTCH